MKELPLQSNFPTIKKMDKILVIEDEKNIRQTIKDILELQNFQVEVAENGLIGVAKALQFKPNLIICDVMMPEMDGFETLKNIRSIKEIASTPFVFLTAKAEKSDFREGMNLGADDFLNKPFNAKELIEVIGLRITKSKKDQEAFSNEVNELQEKVHDLQNTIDNFSYNNSHVLRAPLLKIIGLINFLLEDTIAHNQNPEIMEMIRESCLELSKATEKVENLLNNTENGQANIGN